MTKPNPEEALLNLKICDPACGSGHFLVPRRRMAKHLARIRTGDDEPSLRAIQHAKRDIVGQFVYGVDLNPMATELCKVSLWMEALEPGRPLSFLEHHIQVGNSLLGATPALLRQGIPDQAFEPIKGDDKAVCRDYRKQNRDERNRQTTMFDLFAKSETIRLSNITPAMARIETMRDRELNRGLACQGRGLTGIHQVAALPVRQIAGRRLVRTHSDSRGPRARSPASRDPDRINLAKARKQPEHCPFEVRETIETLARHYNFFHWHLAFLSVFQAERSEDIEEGDILGWKAASTSSSAIRRGNVSNCRNANSSRFHGPTSPMRIRTAIREQLIAGLATQEPALFGPTTPLFGELTPREVSCAARVGFRWCVR